MTNVSILSAFFCALTQGFWLSNGLDPINEQGYDGFFHLAMSLAFWLYLIAAMNSVHFILGFNEVGGIHGTDETKQFKDLLGTAQLQPVICFQHATKCLAFGIFYIIFHILQKSTDYPWPWVLLIFTAIILVFVFIEVQTENEIINALWKTTWTSQLMRANETGHPADKKVIPVTELATRLEEYVKGVGGIEFVDPEDFITTLEISVNPNTNKLTRQDLAHLTGVRARKMFDEFCEDMTGITVASRQSVKVLIEENEEIAGRSISALVDDDTDEERGHKI